MNEESKQNLEEMLSDYIDGELSDRKQTELKRLMEHDEALKERLSELEKQKQLLNSMPAAEAPEGLLDDVMGSLERKFLLNEYSAVSEETDGHKTLFVRRLLTAAIIMVLFGGLAALVINIIMPPIGQKNNNFVNNDLPTYNPLNMPGGSDNAFVPEDKTPVFVASLNLETHHTIAMNSFIKKAIFNNDLSDYAAMPKSDGSETEIKLTGPIDKIETFLGDMKAEWGRCRGTSLAVYDHAMDRDIVIEDVTAEQMLRIFGEGKFYTRMQKVNDIADFNKANPERTYLAVTEDKGTGGPVEKIRPELTTGVRDTGSSDDDKQDAETVCLVVRVIGL